MKRAKERTDPHTSEPPYLQIVHALRRRIREGELSVGERVPSTRRIASEWGVAIATATKALTVLRQEGSIEAVPRMGAVVLSVKPAVSRGSKARTEDHRDESKHDLTREKIVRAGIAIADAEGLDALSMRGVAAKLEAPTMSLYRHVSSKEILIHWMIDVICGEETWPKKVPGGWRSGIALAARRLWALYRRHTWAAHVMSVTRPLALPNVIAYAEWMFACLDGLGLDATMRMHIHILVYSYVRGLAVNLESERKAEAESGMGEDEWMASQAAGFRDLVSSGAVPTFAKVLGELEGGFDLDLDSLFELGLEPMLDGLAALIRKEKKRISSRKAKRS